MKSPRKSYRREGQQGVEPLKERFAGNRGSAGREQKEGTSTSIRQMLPIRGRFIPYTDRKTAGLALVHKKYLANSVQRNRQILLRPFRGYFPTRRIHTHRTEFPAEIQPVGVVAFADKTAKRQRRGGRVFRGGRFDGVEKNRGSDAKIVVDAPERERSTGRGTKHVES